MSVPIGLGGDEARPVSLDLADGVLVVGPSGSGRSTTLLQVARHALAAGLLRAVIARDGLLARLDAPVTATAYVPAAVSVVLDQVRGLPHHPPHVVVIDDLDLLAQACPLEADALSALLRDGLVVVAGRPPATPRWRTAVRSRSCAHDGAAWSWLPAPAGATTSTAVGWDGSATAGRPTRAAPSSSGVHTSNRSSSTGPMSPPCARAPTCAETRVVAPRSRENRATARVSAEVGWLGLPAQAGSGGRAASRVVAATTGGSISATSTTTARARTTMPQNVTMNCSQLTATTICRSCQVATGDRAHRRPRSSARQRGQQSRDTEPEDHEKEADAKRLRPTGHHLDQDQPPADHERKDLEGHADDDDQERGGTRTSFVGVRSGRRRRQLVGVTLL